MLARHFLVFAAVSLLGLTAVGCGGDDDDGIGAAGNAGSSAGGSGGSGNGGSSNGGSSSGGSANGGSGGSVTDSCDSQATCCEQDTKYCADAVTAKPVDPPTSSDTGGGNVMMAVNKLYFGGADEEKAWDELPGLDLDGVASDKKFGGHCKARTGGVNGTIRVDGPGGMDNAFGKDIVPLLAIVPGGLANSANDAISTKGSFSVLLEVAAAETGSNTTATTAKIWPALGQPDGTGGVTPPPASGDWSAYKWNPADQLAEGIAFSGAYINNNKFVSGDPTDINLTLAISGANLALNIIHGTVTGDLSADHKTMTNGGISGALLVDEFQGQISTVAEALGLCDLSMYQSIIDSVLASADLYYDGTNFVLDPDKECNAISLVLGFDATVSSMEDVTDPASEPSDCPLDWFGVSPHR